MERPLKCGDHRPFKEVTIDNAATPMVKVADKVDSGLTASEEAPYRRTGRLAPRLHRERA